MHVPGKKKIDQASAFGQSTFSANSDSPMDESPRRSDTKKNLGCRRLCSRKATRTVGLWLSPCFARGDRLDALATEWKAGSCSVETTDSAAIGANIANTFWDTRSAGWGGSIVLPTPGCGSAWHDGPRSLWCGQSRRSGFAQPAAAAYARYNLRVNCVAPGLTPTPLTASLTRNETLLNASTALLPLGRSGEPEELASAIRWFLDLRQSWITGPVLAVEGGLRFVQARAGSSS